MKKPALWCTALLVAAFSVGAQAQLVIGQTAGFTGPVGAGVKETTDGAKLYIDAVNAKGGVNGQKIELISLDDKFEPKLAAGTQVLVAAASPYTGTPDELAAAATSLRERGAGIIALDCMGYTEAMRDIVATATGLPVVLARSVAARLAAEVLDSLPDATR